MKMLVFVTLLILMSFAPIRFATSAQDIKPTPREDPLLPDDPEDEDAAEGIQCGQILVRGSGHLIQQELSSLLGSLCERPFDGAARDAAAARIVTEYHRRGFLDTSVAWNSPPKAEEIRKSSVVLTIAEGSLYTIRRIEFVNNTYTRDRVIRRRLAFREESPFDQDLLELSLKRLNQLGIFLEVTKADVTTTIDAEEHIVDISIRLKETYTPADSNLSGPQT